MTLLLPPAPAAQQEIAVKTETRETRCYKEESTWCSRCTHSSAPYKHSLKHFYSSQTHEGQVEADIIYIEFQTCEHTGVGVVKGDFISYLRGSTTSTAHPSVSECESNNNVSVCGLRVFLMCS